MAFAVLVYLCIFFLSHKAVPITWSHYYSSDAQASPYIAAEGNELCSATITETANDIYPNGGYRTPEAVALSLIFTWLMWKLPLLMFTLSLIWENENKIIKFGSWGALVLIMLILDIVLSAAASKQYGEYIFYIIYAVLTVGVVVFNYRDRIK